MEAPSVLICLRVASKGDQFTNTDPWNSLLPDLVTTLMMPPVARPYSAW